MSLFTTFKEEVGRELEQHGMSANEIGIGIVSERVKRLMGLADDLEQRAKNGTLPNNSTVEQAIGYLRYQLTELAEVLPNKETEKPCIEGSNDQWENAREIAQTFPIKPVLLQSPDTVTKGKRRRRCAEIQARLLDDVYAFMTNRTGVRQCKTTSQAAMTALRQSCKEIQNLSTTSVLKIELKNKKRHSGFSSGLGLNDEAIITADPRDPAWPFRYKEAIDLRQATNNRCYVTLRPDVLSNIGKHFVNIVDLLRAGGIPVSEAKAASPGAGRNRKESIVLYLPLTSREETETLIRNYDRQNNCLDSISVTSNSTIPGVSWGREPTDSEASVARLIHVDNHAGSYNGFVSALAYSELLERLVAEPEIDKITQKNYKAELARIRPLIGS